MPDVPGDGRFLGVDLVGEPQQPRRNQHPVPLADRQQQQHERSDQQQQGVHRQDVGAVIRVVQRQGRHGDFLQRVDAQAEIATGPQRDVRVQVQHREDQGQRDRGQVQRAGSPQRLSHRRGQARSVALAAVRLAHDEAADEDEALGGRDVEAIAAGDRIQPGVAAEVVDDHGEDAEAAQQVDAQVAPIGCVGRAVVAPRADTSEQRIAQRGARRADRDRWRDGRATHRTLSPSCHCAASKSYGSVKICLELRCCTSVTISSRPAPNGARAT